MRLAAIASPRRCDVGPPRKQDDPTPGELGFSPRGSRPLAATLSRVIQGGTGGRGRLQHQGWPGGWQKSSPLTPNNHSRHQQLDPRSSRPRHPAWVAGREAGEFSKC